MRGGEVSNEVSDSFVGRRRKKKKEGWKMEFSVYNGISKKSGPPPHNRTNRWRSPMQMENVFRKISGALARSLLLGMKYRRRHGPPPV